MAELSKIIIPVKNASTGQVTEEEYNLKDENFAKTGLVVVDGQICVVINK